MDLLSSVQARLSTLGPRNLLLGLGTLAVAALILVIAVVGSGPAWVPVAGNLAMEDVAAVTRMLDDAGIDYRLGAGGLRVEVAEGDLARARVELATGGLPGSSGPGFELFDQPSWGMTDFTQRINYRRALEGELERTITEMQAVESVRVHLALNQSSVLRRDRRPSEASVVVRMRSGARPDAGMVEGVAFLVASSVDGLSSEHVTVLDQSGRLLSRSVEGGSELALNSRQLELRSRVEEYLEGRAQGLLEDIVGAGNVRVRVAAELNLDRVERTVQSVDPDQQLVTREERTELAGAGDGESGSVAYKTDFEATRSVERFMAGVGEIRRLSVAVLLNEQLQDANGERRAAPDPGRMQALVAAAIGVEAGRGDVVSVVSVPFDQGQPVPPVASGPGFWEIWDTLQRPLLTVVALVLAFLLGLKVVRTMAASAPSRPRLADGAQGLSEGEIPAGGLEEKGASLRKQLSPAQAERMQAITTGVVDRPDLAARVVQAWLKE